MLHSELFKVSGGIINIIPKLPSADDEYTPAQRRAIDSQLMDKGFLRTEIRTRKSGKKSKTTKP